jgi:transposase-like protein
MSILSEPHFHNEDAAFARLESIVWPHGPMCPRCGGLDRITKVNGARKGLWRCGPCKRQFTVTVGTVFERSHVPLHKWFQAAHLLASSKKGISAHQLHRTLQVAYKTAWFMEHRLREAMRDGTLPPLGGAGKIVESDETVTGNTKGTGYDRLRKPDGTVVLRGGGPVNRYKVMTLVERGGRARSVHVNSLTANTAARVVWQNVDPASILMTDESNIYRQVGRRFAGHGTVNHGDKEYVRGLAHVNTAEGFFALFKRGMKGIYQHCGERHLHRYLAEFDFRYNHRVALGVSDAERATRALQGIVGKRLTYRDSSAAAVHG